MVTIPTTFNHLVSLAYWMVSEIMTDPRKKSPELNVFGGEELARRVSRERIIGESVPPDTTLRKGKWTTEEEDYATKIISLFSRGLLPIPAGTTLRSYLSETLHW